ncbi:hypothetical protein VIGAN_03223700 [Vigna angularis var. angularis]|uniref:Disease resistance protein At4g27190-like leucine-rich repeats domain-containing protein n=1 Tax=Vigna angularis var. angularis TaxID=157739 RepID=A0A0S3RNT7_PHAAN|nr:hypothetical protein VIGAN_03223700 [Vigna angularis var. angularis]
MIWINHHHSYFENLTSLTVDGCERLAYIFSYPVAVKLVKLQHLLLSSCKFVEKIFEPDENLGHIHHFRKSTQTELVPIFPNLETYVISQMDNLKAIWPALLPQNSFCKLKKMEIASCNNLLNVFRCHVLDKLQSL